MRRCLVLLALIPGIASISACSRADALETFQLGERDKVLYEAQGCNAECLPVSKDRRSCTVRGVDCRVVCQPLSDCRPDGGTPMTVCLVVKR